jgi:hypothetical protein
MPLLKRNATGQKMAALTLEQLKRAVTSGVNLDEAARDIVRYGKITNDLEWENIDNNSRYLGFHRVRKISYLGYIWRHVMHNGQVTALGWTKA